jgi:hypothetical protein
MFFILIFFLLLGNSVAHASVGVADLLYQSSGARAMAMGTAFTAVADDSSYPFWNPAGLHLQDVRWSYFDFQNFMDFNYHFSGSTIVKDNNGLIGLTAVASLSPGIEAYDDVGNFAGTYSDMQGLVNITGGDRVGRDLYWGVSARGFWHGIGADNLWGAAGDVGVLWQMSPKVRLGAVMHAPFSMVSTAHADFDTLDAINSLGIAHWVDDARNILFSADVNFDRQGLHHWATGAEVWVLPGSLALRAGYQNINGMSLGVGLNVGGIHFDYAYLNHAYLGNFHQLSFALMLGSPTAASGVTQENNVQAWTRYNIKAPIVLNADKKNGTDIVAGMAVLDESREYLISNGLNGVVVEIPPDERTVGRHTLEVVLKDRKGKLARQNLFVEFEP